MQRLKLVVMRMPKKKYVATTIVLFQTVALLAVDPTVKQEQINQALAELGRAEGKLNGKQLIFKPEKYIKEELKFQEKNAKFIYAGK